MIGLPSVLKNKVGEDLGTVRYDNDAGRWVVTAVSEEGRSVAQRALDRLGLGGASRVDRTSVSNGKARQAAKRVLDAFEGRGLRDQAGVGVGADSVFVAIRKDASTETRENVQETAEEYRGEVPVVFDRQADVLRPAVSCAFPFCDVLVGGVEWNNSTFTCTMAFYVSQPGGGGNPHALTAGHCINGYGNTWTTCNPGCTSAAGGPQGNRIYGGSDSGLIAQNPGRGAYPGYFNWNSGGLSTVRAYYPYNPNEYNNNNAPQGLVVCKNGRSTRTTCGTISNNFYSRELLATRQDPATSVNAMLLIDGMCIVGGDSGGPVTAAGSETAVGIVSAGNAINDNTTCADAPVAIAEPVGRAVAQLGVQIYGG